MTQQNTTSLCNVCYAEIPAVADPFSEARPVLYKVCPEHGIQRAELETDGEFYNRFSTYEHHNHYATLIINVTDRCNIKCPHCFFPVHNQWDMELEQFQDTIKHFQPHFTSFIISGGDPTCWKYYFQASAWCREQGIVLSQLTNGVKFADPEYLDAVSDNFGHDGYLCAEMSIHPDGYNSKEVKERQLDALRLIRAKGLKLSCIMMNLDPPNASMYETNRLVLECLRFMQEWQDVTETFRLRPICFGWASSKKPVILLSQLVKSLQRMTFELDLPMAYSKTKDTDNIYNQNFRIGGMDVVTVCAAPTVENIDLGYLHRGPWMLAKDGVPYAVPHCLIVNQGIDAGWHRGGRLA